MAICDMCGKEAVYKAVVEGADVNVCESCSRYGKVIEGVKKRAEPKIKYVKKEIKVQPEVVQSIVPNYATLVREAREKKGLKQEELAKTVSEKVSLIHNLEVGKYEPSIKIAQKLERFLKIKLVKEGDEKADLPQIKRAESYTIGDFIKIKKR